AKNGRFAGYVKPFVRDLKVAAPKKGLKKLEAAVVNVVNAALRNRRSKTVAARVPFGGTFQDPRVGLWPAVGTVLHNAFGEGLRRGLEHKTSLQVLHGPPREAGITS
ncbi:MAG TPA: hypothetical protein VNI01_05865, partial [Elusimicrobiota bacterium]|nr:hypothetical protein [Elusimicrobiota bacterium]